MDREWIEELFAPFGPVVVKRMFGGHGVYADGMFFAICAQDEIFLKTDEATRALFATAGSRPFVYQGKSRLVTMSYWLLPDEAFEDEDALRRWARLALDAARRAGAPKAGRVIKRGVRAK